MRAFAVIMMIQGHTIDTFLADDYRSMDSYFYSVWHTMRGFTAPIFMFTAGLIFTYLLKSDHYDFLKNPRIKKGFKRGLLLLGMGYLLRYPTYRIFDFQYVNQKQWDIFFSIDALHLIGFGMLSIIFVLFISKRANIKLDILLYVLIGLLLIISPAINKINWNLYLPQYLSSYLTRAYGSLFPLFPWLTYIFSGALLGNYLYKNDGIYLKKRFSFSLTTIGGILFLLSGLFFSLQYSTKGELSNWLYSTGIVLLRVGFVLVLNGVMAFIVRKIKTIPKIIIETGKKTLLLYVLHIIILYGSAWFPGFYRYYAKSLTTIETLAVVALMLGIMLAVVQISNKISLMKKAKLALRKV